jgi:Ulp1 family protease
MATIANQNGSHMVQHVLLPVNIHFHWNLFIFEFLYWWPLWNGGHFENFNNKEHNFEWWSIFVSSFKRIHCTVWI